MAVGGEFNDVWLAKTTEPSDAEQPTPKLNYGAWVAETEFSPNGALLLPKTPPLICHTTKNRGAWLRS